MAPSHESLFRVVCHTCWEIERAATAIRVRDANRALLPRLRKALCMMPEVCDSMMYILHWSHIMFNQPSQMYQHRHLVCVPHPLRATFGRLRGALVCAHMGRSNAGAQSYMISVVHVMLSSAMLLVGGGNLPHRQIGIILRWEAFLFPACSALTHVCKCPLRSHLR